MEIVNKHSAKAINEDRVVIGCLVRDKVKNKYYILELVPPGIETKAVLVDLYTVKKLRL